MEVQVPGMFGPGRAAWLAQKATRTALVRLRCCLSLYIAYGILQNTGLLLGLHRYRGLTSHPFALQVSPTSTRLL